MRPNKYVCRSSNARQNKLHLSGSGGVMGNVQLRTGGFDQADGDKIIADHADGMPVTFTIAELMAIMPTHVPSNVNEENLGNQLSFYALTGS
jgi:hypothetical protein